MIVSCAWCGRVLRQGTGPMSHGMCEACFERELASVDERVRMVEPVEPGRKTTVTL